METLSFPRELLKWVQSLNLTVSVKDVRRDFLNGYVIADIISTYHKNVIFLHSFENSHNQYFKTSNWILLEKAFIKISFAVKPVEYQEIKNGNPNQLINLMVKLFKFLTNRMIEVQKKSKLETGQTQTYLLTETGLENINIENKKFALRQNYNNHRSGESDTGKKIGSEETDNKDKHSSNIQDLQQENDDENELAVSKNDIINMIFSNEKLIDNHKNSISSMKSILIKKDLNSSGHIIEKQKPKSRLMNTNANESKFVQKTGNEGSKTKIEELSQNGNNMKEYKLVYERINDFIRICQKELDFENELPLPDNSLLYYHFSTSVNLFKENFVERLMDNLSKNVSLKVRGFIEVDD